MRFVQPLPAEDLEYIKRGVGEYWPELRGARILITGATGFFGRWMLESLLSANDSLHLGAHVVALSRDPDGFLGTAPHLSGAGVTWMRGSVASLATEAFDQEEFDAVIHLATEANLQSVRAEPAAAIDVITGGTQRVLDVAGRTGARRFLFTSSGAVYGPQPVDIEYIDESYCGNPGRTDSNFLYAIPGEAKRQAELLCVARAHADGLGAVIARCFTFAGPGLPTDSGFAFGNLMRDALSGGPLVIKGDGTAIRSYLHAADLTIWLWVLLLAGVPGRAYNVGSEKAVSIRQLAEVISKELGVAGIRVLQQPVSGSNPERYVPSTLRAREEIGLSERFSLPEIVRKTAAWHRAAVKR
jgi:nucleoside-diphosphate-sugar epimerase